MVKLKGVSSLALVIEPSAILAMLIVPVKPEASKSATENVPKPTIYNSSSTVAPELRVIVLPSVAV